MELILTEKSFLSMVAAGQFKNTKGIRSMLLIAYTTELSGFFTPFGVESFSSLLGHDLLIG